MIKYTRIYFSIRINWLLWESNIFFLFNLLIFVVVDVLKKNAEDQNRDSSHKQTIQFDEK